MSKSKAWIWPIYKGRSLLRRTYGLKCSIYITKLFLSLTSVVLAQKCLIIIYDYKKNSINIHLGSFAAKISNQPLKRRNQLSFILLSMHISSERNVARLRVDQYHPINLFRGFLWPKSFGDTQKKCHILRSTRKYELSFFRHTQPNAMEQKDSDKFTDLMEITSSQLFVYLSRWNFDDIGVKRLYFVLKVIRNVFSFGIEFLENKDIDIFIHFIKIDFIKWYIYHAYFWPISTSWFRRFGTGYIVRNGEWCIFVNNSVISALFPLKLRVF